jgi:hypothetical protein
MPMLKAEKTNAWAREAHRARARALPALPKMLDFESSTLVLPTRPPVPEQDVARSQRNRAQVFSQRDVLAALAYAQEAIEPAETVVDRASRYLRELMGAR